MEEMGREREGKEVDERGKKDGQIEGVE